MPLVAPSGTAITLVATANVVPINGSVDVYAVLIEGGAIAPPTGTATVPAGTGTPVHNGTLVTFTTSLGRIEPAQARTESGKASVKLYANGQSGTATITAFSGAATKTLDVKIGSAAAARIIVTALPQALPSNGGNSTIAASVQDQQGNGLLGVPVSFSTDVGTLSSTVALTDTAGNAATVLSTTAGPVTVTASAGGGTTGTLTGSVKVTLKTRSAPTITAPTGTITQSVPATFTVGLSTGAVVTGVALDLGDGTKVQLGAITGNTTFAYMYGDDGAYTVTATATDLDGTQTSASVGIVVVSLTLAVSASATNTTVGTVITFTATPGATGVAIDRYEWSFDDGSSVVSSSTQATHAFTAAGTYNVTVTLVPSKGHSKTALVTIKVT
jgi:hypothetical protein